jgi:phenylacetic acid degradation protein PaaD
LAASAHTDRENKLDSLEKARRSAAVMLENDTSSKALGISVDVPAAGSARASMTVRDDMLNGFGVCHGGLVFTLADTAFAFACNAYNDETLSIEADINWRKTAHRGDRLLAVASEDRREGRHGYYSVRVTNQDEALVAEFRGHSISRGQALFDDKN